MDKKMSWRKHPQLDESIIFIKKGENNLKFEFKKQIDRVISGTLASAMALGLLPSAMIPVEATEIVEVVEANSCMAM